MIREVGAGLQAALLLARGRAEGLRLIDGPPDAAMSMAVRSFWAAALCLPGFICLHLLDWTQSGMPPEPARDFAMDLLGYVIGWAGFALVSRSFAARLGRARQWSCFITAWNWCNVIQYVMLVVASLPVLLGVPDLMSETIWLVAMGWALWLEWFATRHALGISPLQAASLVAIDATIGLFIVGVTASFGS